MPLECVLSLLNVVNRCQIREKQLKQHKNVTWSQIEQQIFEVQEYRFGFFEHLNRSRAQNLLSRAPAPPPQCRWYTRYF